MTEIDDLIMMIRGIVASLPEVERAAVAKALDHLRQAVASFGDSGKLALAVLGAELVAQEEPTQNQPAQK